MKFVTVLAAETVKPDLVLSWNESLALTLLDQLICTRCYEN